MKVRHVVPLIIGVGVLLFGVLLVHTNGYLGSTYLPGIVGIQPCTAGSSNSTTCAFSGAYGGYGIGTIVCLFGLGLLTSSLRGLMAQPMAGGGIPPAALSALGGAQSFPTPTAAAPGLVYCSRCGSPNPGSAKFCHQCAAPISVAPPVNEPPKGA